MVVELYPILYMELMVLRSNYVILSPTLSFRRSSALGQDQKKHGKRTIVGHVEEDTDVPMNDASNTRL